MKDFFRWIAVLLVSGSASQAQTVDALGMHNLSPGTGAQVTTQATMGCTLCHAPHSGIGGNTPLWNQTLSKANYEPYTSTTYHQTGNAQPTLGVTSSLCLSCHDGTVGVGQTATYGQVPTNGVLADADSFGTKLVGSHPFSLVLPIKDASSLSASLTQQGKTADPAGAVKLVNGNIECTSCHDPHVQNIDRVAQQFLVRDSSAGQMCLACHDPNRVMQGQVNPLAGWVGSSHQTATNQVTPDAQVGPYATVALNACESCHQDHKSVSAARLLRAANPAAPNLDTTTQSCITCHNGGNLVSPAAPNVMAEYAKISHLLPAGNNGHDAAEPAVLINNRHATCVDCHNPHAAQQGASFGLPPAIRPPQTGVLGVSASDGTTPLTPAVNQFENCFRCHGTGPGKQTLLVYGYAPTRAVTPADPLNEIPVFSSTASSSHPVTHDRSSTLPQPSLLLNMLNLNGTMSSRPVSPRIFCTDCHNSDDNREFGGNGANGPHGSSKAHLLERNYQFSQASVPGGPVTNTFPNPDLSVNGPYSVCAKCHDLSQVLANTSWAKHSSHVGTDGFSCSVCHTAHGVGAMSSNLTGERLVNFDVKVVGANNSLPIAYNRSSGTCTLTCHQVAHNADGTVSAVSNAIKTTLK
ncbi:MAG TPA: cytochrome c3 family protein [Terriglobales bacterium]|nr:cytochrome c3 family protein [Terriglobales bacterium]